MICLTVDTEVSLLHSTELLQFLVQDVHCLLHALPLSHRHLAHAAGQTRHQTTVKALGKDREAKELASFHYGHEKLSGRLSVLQSIA